MQEGDGAWTGKYLVSRTSSVFTAGLGQLESPASITAGSVESEGGFVLDRPKLAELPPAPKAPPYWLTDALLDWGFQNFVWIGDGLLAMNGAFVAEEPRRCPPGAPCIAPEEFQAPLQGVHFRFD